MRVLILAVWLLPMCFTFAAEPEMKLAIMDFCTIDTVGEKFYRFTEQKLPLRPVPALSTGDRLSISRRMQGFVRMLQSQAVIEENRHDMYRQDLQNDREYRRREALGDKILNSPQRVTVIGGEYMTALLAGRPEFTLIDRGSLDNALLALADANNEGAIRQAAADFKDHSGATHVLYGVVSDANLTKKNFSGYGLHTEKYLYSLDLLVKVIELKSGKIYFSGLFTGTYSKLTHNSSQTIETGLYEQLFKSAAQQAAEALCEKINRDAKTGSVK